MNYVGNLLKPFNFYFYYIIMADGGMAVPDEPIKCSNINLCEFDKDPDQVEFTYKLNFKFKNDRECDVHFYLITIHFTWKELLDNIRYYMNQNRIPDDEFKEEDYQNCCIIDLTSNLTFYNEGNDIKALKFIKHSILNSENNYIVLKMDKTHNVEKNIKFNMDGRIFSINFNFDQKLQTKDFMRNLVLKLNEVGYEREFNEVGYYRITDITDGKIIKNYEIFKNKVFTNPGHQFSLELQRGGKRKSKRKSKKSNKSKKSKKNRRKSLFKK